MGGLLLRGGVEVADVVLRVQSLLDLVVPDAPGAQQVQRGVPVLHEEVTLGDGAGATGLQPLRDVVLVGADAPLL